MVKGKLLLCEDPPIFRSVIVPLKVVMSNGFPFKVISTIVTSAVPVFVPLRVILHPLLLKVAYATLISSFSFSDRTTFLLNTVP